MKLAYAIEMAFEVPDVEKQVATQASERFEAVLNSLNLAKDHLDIMYEPFKRHENISPEAVVEKRGVISRYKQQVKKNYNKVKQCALFSIEKLNYFATDTHILELINSFRDSIQDVEKQVNILLDILDDYESPDFRNNVIAGIEGVKKQSAQVDKLIRDRIIDHIDTNILAKNWMTNTGDELQMKIKNRIPVITQLYNERQEALEAAQPAAMPQTNKRPQTMNPGNTQRVYYPNDLRNTSMEE
jgi:hypothetical protein